MGWVARDVFLFQRVTEMKIVEDCCERVLGGGMSDEPRRTQGLADKAIGAVIISIETGV
jgi:hypothetical protein